MCRPDWAITASRPTVLIATVFPPVFGPVMTRIWNWRPRWMSIGVTWRGSRGVGGGSAPSSGPSASARLRAEQGFEQGMPGAPEESLPSVLKSGGDIR